MNPRDAIGTSTSDRPAKPVRSPLGAPSPANGPAILPPPPRWLAILGRYTHPSFLRHLAGLLLRRYLLRQPVIIVERKAGMGDVLFTIPACLELRKTGPVHLVYLSSNHLLPMLRRSGAADRVMSADYRQGLLAVIRPSRFILFKTPDDGDQGIHGHLIEFFLAQAGASGSAPFNVTLGEGITPDKPERKPYVVIHTGPTWPVREWPHESWVRLTEMLAGEGLEVIQIGDRNPAAESSDGSGPIQGATVRIGQLDTVGLMDLLRGTELFIGIDSGPLYLAAALDRPTVGLFGPVNPSYRLFGTKSVGCFAEVECRFCHHEPQRLHWKSGCPHQIRCMTALSPEQVFATVMTRLRHPNGTKLAQ